MTLRCVRWGALASVMLASGACSDDSLVMIQVEGGNAYGGRLAVRSHECGVCHVIPDVPGAVGQVGPPLGAFARRPYIAGKFPNRPDVLIRFIPNAPSLAPATGMPAIAMSDADARDIAAYLYTLK